MTCGAAFVSERFRDWGPKPAFQQDDGGDQPGRLMGEIVDFVRNLDRFVDAPGYGARFGGRGQRSALLKSFPEGGDEFLGYCIGVFWRHPCLHRALHTLRRADKSSER